MKRAISLLLCLCWIMWAISVPKTKAQNDVPQVAAASAVVIEAQTGRILYEKNAHVRRPMASTTKIMTAIIAIENGSLNDIVEISPEAAAVGGSSIWLEAGEYLTLEQLLYGLMLRSGNDAATAIAEHIGGTVQGFVDMMNRKAVELGAKDTHFVNPHGLDAEGHYTTAYDLALIAAYAMKNPVFRQIVSTKYAKIPWKGHEWGRDLQNTNRLLWQYEGINGIKTGFTGKAGQCLVSAAYRNDMQLITVVLNDGSRWWDSMALMDYAFKHYSMYTVLSQGQFVANINVSKGKSKTVGLQVDRNIAVPLSESERNDLTVKFDYSSYVKAPVEAGTAYGTAKVFIGDNLIATGQLISSNSIEEKNYFKELRGVLKQWLNPIF